MVKHTHTWRFSREAIPISVTLDLLRMKRTLAPTLNYSQITDERNEQIIFRLCPVRDLCGVGQLPSSCGTSPTILHSI